ncbi:hypothetical protein OQ252_04850 [Acetobacter farinalis]|uniref:Uncharacterized protein n=1 Tax=Acetobacter farinalis TaxID=1260984 RepID=A0ABT3Q672_9PROT|nr:hypothetical protein [Acetobacter farinalis]MCX2560731.1 hypothetical protein [Acetobacter farinalis]NHO29129.1 hypothetical protein [Acetobacter farinalis]
MSGRCLIPTDPDVHLLSNTGAVIRPMRREGVRYSFMLLARIRYVWIMSRVMRPVDVFGPVVGDQRVLGVFVGNMTFARDKRPVNVRVFLEKIQPEGWYEPSLSGCAWTNGRALLPLEESAQGAMGILSFDVRAGGPYSVGNSDQNG